MVNDEHLYFLALELNTPINIYYILRPGLRARPRANSRQIVEWRALIVQFVYYSTLLEFSGSPSARNLTPAPYNDEQMEEFTSPSKIESSHSSWDVNIPYNKTWQIESRASRQDYERALTRTQDIRIKLEGDPSLAEPFPDNPNGMWW